MSLGRELDAVWGALLKGHGFRKSRGIHTLDLGEAWLGWLGLNRSLWNGTGRVDVLPVVGICWKPLEGIFQELNPQLPKSTSATLTRPLYTLLPESYTSEQFILAQWRVREEKGEPFRLEEVLDAAVLWGIPFMQSLCDPEGVADKLRPPSHFEVNQAVPWKTYPIALVLTGRQAEAVEVVRGHAQEVAEKPDMASKAYAEFSARFLEKFA
ncbi:hypothetical protein NNX39_13550 [Arthrobacter sp. zg-Y826]|uniref:hypothetical protein n=1 Tax=Arthrobacter jinronghuae TaxID=2964609 RepID=UPI0021082339|nr:hypothetical protein [Arthrobacter jinronghuae]MCQ1957522.1 hypothetical protein [Arthrobacter jinronghuae]